MGLFILEDSTVDRLAPPGTSLLEDIAASPASNAPILKHAPGRPDLILIPCPSDDPRDPLNWSWARKEACFVTLCFGTALAGVVGPLVAPAFVALITELDEPLQRVVQINGSLVLAIGFGSLFFGPLFAKWGSRPVFLIASLLMFVSSIWAGATSSYISLVAARTVQGLAMGAYFSNVPGCINHLYFLHSRAFRLSLWNLSLIGGINIGPVISAQIIEGRGYKFTFYMFAVAAGLSFLATVAFCPETTYDRSYYYSAIESRMQGDTESKGTKDTAVAEVRPIEEGQKGWRLYLPFTGSKSEVALWRLIVKPFFFVLSPACIFGAIIFSVTFNLLPLLATVYAQIFTAPPYNFSTAAVGLVGGIPPLIGTLIGTFTSGPVSDWLIKYLSIKNGGVFEPEFRLLPLAGFAAFGGAGTFGWAASVAAQDAWIVQAIMIALLHVGISAGTIACIGYVSEVAGESASDAVALVTFVKSVIGFGIIFFVNDWLATQGLIKFLNSLGALIVVTCALAVPMWIFGKRTRSFALKHGVSGN